MAELVDPRRVGSEFDGIDSDDPGLYPEAQRHSEATERQENPQKRNQVDPRKEYREFDGIRSSG